VERGPFEIGQAVGMSVPHRPAFLLDGNDVVVIADASAVRRELEAFLAEEPVEFYDACARRLGLVADARGLRLEAVSNEEDGDHLRAALTRFLETTGRAAPDLGDLVQFATSAASLIH
jgi:hypothetical protein